MNENINKLLKNNVNLLKEESSKLKNLKKRDKLVKISNYDIINSQKF